ncbi:MAG: ABC transporter permease [Actinobacteria bacterium]|nr:ABC transporter permease [Actinomycetota bacterium]
MATKVERPEKPETRIGRILRAEEFGVVVAIIGVVVVAISLTPNFAVGTNINTILQQISYVAICAAGMSLVVICGEIDLSIGSIYGLGAVMYTWLSVKLDWPVLPSIVLTLILGVFIGWLNGYVSVRLNIPSFVVTLAGLGALRGAILLIAGGVPIYAKESKTFTALVGGSFLGISSQVFWMLALCTIVGVILAKTKFGSDLYAIGGNKVAAQNAGINVSKVKIQSFIISSFLATWAGIMLVGWLGSSNPLTGQGSELLIVGAIAVGGASLFGGSGTILGATLGAIVGGLITNVLVLVGVNGNWTFVANGLLILAAVVINTLVRKKRKTLRT